MTLKSAYSRKNVEDRGGREEIHTHTHQNPLKYTSELLITVGFPSMRSRTKHVTDVATDFGQQMEENTQTSRRAIRTN